MQTEKIFSSAAYEKPEKFWVGVYGLERVGGGGIPPASPPMLPTLSNSLGSYGHGDMGEGIVEVGDQDAIKRLQAGDSIQNERTRMEFHRRRGLIITIMSCKENE